MAEVSASAVAVEQLDRQGRLNLQPAVAQASQEWAQDEGEEEETSKQEEQEEEENGSQLDDTQEAAKIFL